MITRIGAAASCVSLTASPPSRRGITPEHSDLTAATALARDLELCPGCRGPLVHDSQAQATGWGAARIKSPTVVCHRQAHALAGEAQRDPDPCRLSVFDDVVQRLLRDAIESYVHVDRQVPPPYSVHVYPELAATRHRVSELLQQVRKRTVGERGGSQLQQQRAHFL